MTMEITNIECTVHDIAELAIRLRVDEEGRSEEDCVISLQIRVASELGRPARGIGRSASSPCAIRHRQYQELCRRRVSSPSFTGEGTRKDFAIHSEGVRVGREVGNLFAQECTIACVAT
jgi:hypothetical protein